MGQTRRRGQGALPGGDGGLRAPRIREEDGDGSQGIAQDEGREGKGQVIMSGMRRRRVAFAPQEEGDKYYGLIPLD